MRVLIVDDESLIRMDLREQLEKAGHIVVGEGTNGVEALSLVKEKRPDVLLMDIKMPKLDGIEAARQIARLDICPVVLLTAYSQEDLIEKARESGVYGYLVKPVREAHLVPALKMAIGRFQELGTVKSDILRLEQTLEERKIIEKAKGILMKVHGLSEEEAFRRMRSYSMEKGRTMGDLAFSIVQLSQKKK